MQIHAGRWDAKWRFDLEKALPREEGAHGGEHPRTRRQMLANPMPGSAREIAVATRFRAMRARDEDGVPELTRLITTLGDHELAGAQLDGGVEPDAQRGQRIRDLTLGAVRRRDSARDLCALLSLL